MNTAAISDTASRWARMLEDKHGTAKAARLTHCAPDTIETLRRGRKKNICVRLWTDLRIAVIRELTREIQGLTHEIQIARQAGIDPRSGDLLVLDAAMAKAKSLRDDLG